MPSIRFAAAAAALLLVGATPPPPSAPRLNVASFEQLPKPLPLPYDEQADAGRAVAAAKARAARTGKRLLIDLGGNWCLDCRLLAGTMDLPPLHAWLTRRYEIVTVNVGRFDRNLAVPAHYGITARLPGVPAVLIVDPATDRLVNRESIAALADARSMTPQAVADWLAQWAPR